MQNNFYLEDSGSLLKLKSEDTGATLASISYSIEEIPTKHLYIHCVASKEKQKGYYHKLFREVENIAKNNDCNSLRCKTGFSEKYEGVRKIHQKYGFTFLPQTKLDKQRQRIGLEKRLLN